jgi:SMC interacting uncharacterized protein involved in chromosome segregation
MSILKSFSAFGAVVPKVRTVASITAPLQAVVRELSELISERSTRITATQAEIITLEKRIDEDQQEINSAKSIQEKWSNFLN